MNGWLGLFVVFMLWGSGCLGGPSSGSPSTSVPASPSVPLVPDAVRFERCTGVVGSFEAPYTVVRALVPVALRAYGLTPVTASVLFQGLSCDRAASADRVIEDPVIFQMMARVVLENKSWGEEGKQSRYVFDTFVSPELVAALGALGIPAKAATLDASEVGSGVGPVVRLWKFRSENASIELEYQWHGEKAGGFKDTFLQWYGEHVLRRVDHEEHMDFDTGVSGGVLRIIGSTEGKRTMPTCCVEWDGQGIQKTDEVWTSNGRPYQS